MQPTGGGRRAWRGRGRLLLAMMGLTLSVAACGEVAAPLEPETLPGARVEARSPRAPLPEQGYACVLGVRDGATGTYRYHRLSLAFPAGLAREGGTARYRYRGLDGGAGYAFFANCTIPRDARAADWLTREFRGGPVPPGSESDGASLLACRDGEICLAPIEATVCQYRGTYPNCKPPLAGEVPPCYDGGGCGGGDPISTGGGGPICEDCYPEDEDPPCETGDPLVDAPAVQNGMKQLWMRSNSDAAMAERREAGGFVVLDPLLGYVLHPFPESWAATACAISPPPGFIPPVNAVAWVHTHPYGRDELLTSCPSERIVIGGTVFEAFTKYQNDPSADDGRMAQQWGLPGYVLDREKITRFTGNPSSSIKYDITLRTNRCAY